MRDQRSVVESDEDQVKDSLSILANGSATAPERDAAKNMLILAVVKDFRPKILKASGGRIGIDDATADLTNSAFIYLRDRASKIADEVNVLKFPITAVVAKWIQCWAIDKIRRATAAKRGGNKQHLPIDDWDDLLSRQSEAERSVLQAELDDQLTAAVQRALLQLDDVESAVCVCRTGIGRTGEGLSMADIAAELELPHGEISRAWRRAKRKLGVLLTEFEESRGRA